MPDQLDELIARQFNSLDDVAVPDTWDRIVAATDTESVSTPPRRWVLGLVAASVLVVVGVVVWVAMRGEPQASVATPTVTATTATGAVTTPTAAATAPTIAVTTPPVASAPPTTAPTPASSTAPTQPPATGYGSAAVDPSTVAQGDTVNITPSEPVEPTCNEIGVLRARHGQTVIAQLKPDGTFLPGPDVTWLACESPRTDEPQTYRIPDVVPGDYILCVTQELESAGCATITIAVSSSASPVGDALVEPLTVAPGDPVRITPSAPVSATCGGLAVLRPLDATATVAGQLGLLGWWDSGFDPRLCLPALVDDTFTYVTPDVPAGDYLLCVTPEVDAAGCGAVTIASPAPATPGVSYRSPPPVLPMRELATVALTPRESGEVWVDVAIGDRGIVVNQSWAGFVTVVGFDGSQADVAVDGDLGQLAFGPGDVVYGTRGGATMHDFAMVAVALSGERAGTLLESRPVNINQFVELPVAAVGHGPDGIVNRDRNPSATVFPYVGIDALSTQWAGEPPPFVATLHSTYTDDVAVNAGDGRSWRLGIDAAPDRASPFIGPSPASPGPDGSIVYWTHIGPNARPDVDFGEPTMWVLAVLGADGAIEWWSLPEAWEVVSSDVWGTVLGRVVDGQLELALADIAPAD